MCYRVVSGFNHYLLVENCARLSCQLRTQRQSPGDTPYNGLHGEAPPERGTFFRLQVFKRAFNYNISNRPPYGCISLFNFIKHYMKMRTRLPKVGM